MALPALDVIPSRKKSAISRLLNENLPGKTQAIIVLPGIGKVKVINEVGARIWSFVNGVYTIGEIAEKICQEFDVELAQAQQDTLEFLVELDQKGAIELS
jgi:hypothetical protein